METQLSQSNMPGELNSHGLLLYDSWRKNTIMIERGKLSLRCKVEGRINSIQLFPLGFLWPMVKNIQLLPQYTNQVPSKAENNFTTDTQAFNMQYSLAYCD